MLKANSCSINTNCGDSYSCSLQIYYSNVYLLSRKSDKGSDEVDSWRRVSERPLGRDKEIVLALLMEEISPLIMQLGFGGVLGFTMGYAIKKVLKILLILSGLYAASLQYLAYKGYITIHFDRISESFRKILELAQGGFTLPNFLTANIPFIGSFTAGLGLGFKTG